MPIYKSPSTSIRNVDLIAKPNPSLLPGVPGLVVGTSRRGIPFVPIKVNDFENFISLFGNVDSQRFGPIALKLWVSGANRLGAYLKVLGVGDGKNRIKKGINAGSVKDAGFVVGSQQVQTGSGTLTNNSHAYLGGPPGRTYFLGCFMSESLGSTIFSDANIQNSTTACPIIRGVLMAASGVTLSLNTEKTANNDPTGKASAHFGTSGDAGLSYGDILLGDGDQQKFIVILNGFKSNEDYKNTITASFDPKAPLTPTPAQAAPLRVAFNTDPTKIERAGHYLHLFHDIPIHIAEPTGSNITGHEDTNKVDSEKSDGSNFKLYQTAFLLSSSLPRNTGSAPTVNYVGNPNFENFEDRYSSSFSPTIFSQKFLGKKYDLFKIHALDAGDASALNYKITIGGFNVGSGLGTTEYPKFDLHLRKIDQADQLLILDSPDTEGTTLESWLGLTLDPSDPKFISRVIGDKHLYYDFDKRTSESQRVVDDGNFYGGSALIRVEVSDDVKEKKIPPSALPVGFRGLYHLVTSGTTSSGTILTGTAESSITPGSLLTSPSITSDILGRVIEPPVMMRESIFILDDTEKKIVKNSLTWGFQTENKPSLSDPNKIEVFNTSSLSFMKFMPNFHTSYQNAWIGNNHGTPDINGVVLDADRFNNNSFSLENIEVIKDGDDKPDKTEWAHAIYNRSGKEKGKLLNKDELFKSSRLLRNEDIINPDNSSYLKFTFPLIGGFDGTNIFDYEKKHLTNTAIIREINDPNQGGRKGPTVRSYIKALDILEENKDFEMSIFSIPGIRHEVVVDEAIELATRRADTFFVFDIQERDDLNQRITSSLIPTEESLKNTRNSFTNNPRETTYAAGFFPDLEINVGNESSQVFLPMHRVPPSVSIMGRLAATPAHVKITGPTMGTLNAIKSYVAFDDKNIDDFFQSGINIIAGTSLEGSPEIPFIRSQNTSTVNRLPLSRIPVRRMMNLVKREVRQCLRPFLFANLSNDLYRKMRSTLNSKLADLQSLGMFKFYQVDVPETIQETRDDINNNLVGVRILIRPNDVTESLILDMEEGL